MDILPTVLCELRICGLWNVASCGRVLQHFIESTKACYTKGISGSATNKYG